jgi:hypothetical protein
VPGDAFFAFLVRGHVPPWLPEARERNEVVLSAAAAAAGRLTGDGCTVVYEGVVVPESLPAFLAETGLDELHVAVLLPSLARCLSRVARREGHGFHDLAATRHMHEQFAAARLAERHVLREPGDGPAAVVDVVLDRLAAGELRVPAPGGGQGAG